MGRSCRTTRFHVISPITEEAIATISLGSSTDVENAVAAAKRAFESDSDTTLEGTLGASAPGSRRLQIKDGSNGREHFHTRWALPSHFRERHKPLPDSHTWQKS